MPRELRIQYPGAIYHVLNRGDETTMSLKWIAQRLRMGNWTYVSNLLSHEPMPRTEPAGQLLLYQ